MKKLITLTLVTLFIPQMVFAAWWNPFSWFKKEETKNINLIQKNDVTNNDKKGNAILAPVVSVSSDVIQTENISNRKKNVIKQKSLTTINEEVNNSIQQTQKIDNKEDKVQPVVAPTIKTCLSGVVISINDNCTKTCPDGEIVLETLSCRIVTQPAQNNQQSVIDQSQIQEQQKQNQIKSMLVEWSSKKNVLDQKILDIKIKLSNDIANVQSSAGTNTYQQGSIDNLTNKANTNINNILLQEEQLRLDYLARYNALQ